MKYDNFRETGGHMYMHDVLCDWPSKQTNYFIERFKILCDHHRNKSSRVRSCLDKLSASQFFPKLPCALLRNDNIFNLDFDSFFVIVFF